MTTLLEPLFRSNSNEREQVRYAELRDTLLPKLMSGAVRVPDAAEMAGI
ncbi:MAG: restriction endonuclease subunit S [Verrucomicrobiota bacterium]